MHGELEKEGALPIGLANPGNQRPPAPIFLGISLVYPIPGEVSQAYRWYPGASGGKEGEEGDIADNPMNGLGPEKADLLVHEGLLSPAEGFQGRARRLKIEAQAVLLDEADVEMPFPDEKRSGHILLDDELGEGGDEHDLQTRCQVQEMADHFQGADRVPETMGGDVVRQATADRLLTRGIIERHGSTFRDGESKFTSALVYPAFVSVVGVATMFFFMSYMLPKYMTIFEGMNVPLPWMTQLLVNISHLFSGYWWLMLGVVIEAVIVFKRFQATDEGRRTIDRWRMNAPVFGKVIKLNIFGQFARTLCTLLANGVTLLTALNIVRETLTGTVLRENVARIAEGVKEGRTLAGQMNAVNSFPPLAIHLVRVGEETGQLESMLLQLAEIFDREVRVAVQRALALLEPVLIIGLGVIVGGIIMSILMAIMSINDLAF